MHQLNLTSLFLVAVTTIYPLTFAHADTVVVDRSAHVRTDQLPESHGRGGNLLGSDIATTSFIGNGQRLSKVGVYFAHSSPAGVPNLGDINSLQWDFYLWRPSSDFVLDPWRQNPGQPTYNHRYLHPSNLKLAVCPLCGWTLQCTIR